MLNKVLDFINRNEMIEKGDRIAVGVSGGADSVCLLYILKQLYGAGEVKLIAVHVNHGLRGEEADQDEQFVKKLCQGWGIDFYPFLYDVRKLAAAEGLSEEEAGRKVRYQSFIEVSRHFGCNKIAVAHNKNDNAETFLFRLFRGTGMKGLSGIEPIRVINKASDGIRLIRPLLCVQRNEIEEFLEQEGITYRIDSTNLTSDYSRNKIRNKILKFASEEINSQSVANISETAGRIKEAFEYIDKNAASRYRELVKKEENIYRLAIKELLKEPAVIQKEILRKVLEELAGKLKDLEARHIEAVLSLCLKQIGKQVQLPYGMIAEREYTDIKVYVKNEGFRESLTIEPLKIEIPGRTIIRELGKIFETEVLSYKKSEPVPKSSCVKWFDYDKIENAVVVRNRKEGDYIQINASGGSKKLKDYFIDHKIPKPQRDSQLLIADGRHIMWITGAGERISEKYKVDKATSRVLLMKLIDLEGSCDGR